MQAAFDWLIDEIIRAYVKGRIDVAQMEADLAEVLRLDDHDRVPKAICLRYTVPSRPYDDGTQY